MKYSDIFRNSIHFARCKGIILLSIPLEVPNLLTISCFGKQWPEGCLHKDEANFSPCLKKLPPSQSTLRIYFRCNSQFVLHYQFGLARLVCYAKRAEQVLYFTLQGKRGSGGDLYIRERFDCLELNDGDDRVECLWGRIRGKTSMADILVESVMDYPTRMKRQTEYSISNWKIKSYNH